MKPIEERSPTLKSYYKHHKKWTLPMSRRGKLFYQANKERLKKEAMDRYWKKKAENPEAFSRYHREIYKRHRIAYIQTAKDKAKALKEEMIKAYGGHCTCCGEAEHIFLTLDHVNNDGKVHRLKVKGSGSAVYWDLKKRGWPTDNFTLLCANCNFGRQWNHGHCPHAIKALEIIQWIADEERKVA